jgi:phosphoglycerol transferase
LTLPAVTSEVRRRRPRPVAGFQLNEDLRLATASVVATTVLAALVLQLWDADLMVPFTYAGGDSLLVLALVKGILEHGWHLTNPSVGAPTGLDLHDFPVMGGNTLLALTVRLLGEFSSSPPLVLNIVFLLTFPITAAASFFSMRALTLSPPVASVCSILFALLPYHFLRGEAQLLIAAYYTVPIGAYLVLSVLDERPLFTRQPAARMLTRFATRRTFLTLALCVVVAAAGALYYGVFTIVLVIGAGAIAAFARRSVRPLATAGAVVAAIGVSLMVNLSPSLLYQLEHGTNDAVADRGAHETELFGLKLVEMVLPVDHHRVQPLADLTQRYRESTPLPGEGSQALGFVGTFGLVALLAMTLASALPASERRVGTTFLHAGTATVLALLVAFTGGLSSVAAFLVSAQVHAWNRMSIFVAFFSLLAVGLMLDALRRRIGATPPGRRLFAVGLVALVGLGVLDQTTQGFAPSSPSLAATYGSDAAFVAEVERRLPHGAAVYQLPYASFPEGRPRGRMQDYDEFRGYLHSRDLRWSYAAMRGRPADWGFNLARLPVEETVAAVTAAGFRGIYVDRFGYADSARALEARLARLVGTDPLVSPNARLSFFDLRRYAATLDLRLRPEEIAALGLVTVKPVRAHWGGDFWPVDRTGQQTLRWTKRPEASLELLNPSERVRTVSLRATLATGRPVESSVVVSYPDGGSETLRVSAAGVELTRVLRLRPGRNLLRLSSDARPALKAMGDTRSALFLAVSDAAMLDVTFGRLFGAESAFAPLFDIRSEDDFFPAAADDGEGFVPASAPMPS